MNANAPIVFLHGWGLHGGIWDATLQALAGRICLAPDLPGYGAALSVQPYTVDRLADRLAAATPSPAVLVGWSLGGMVALAWAAMWPERVRGLVLVGATPAFVQRADWPHAITPVLFETFAHSLAHDWRATLQRFLALQARGSDAARTVIGRLRAILFAHGEPAPETLAAGLDLLRTTDLRPRLADVRVPTLIVHGGRDTLCPPAAAEWLAANLTNARLALLPHAAHAPFLSHPEAFRTRLEEFLDALD